MFKHLKPISVKKPPVKENSDFRLGHLIGSEIDNHTRCALIGFPSDEGVRRNGGRTGAAQGPNAIRSKLYKMTPDPRRKNSAEAFKHVVDLGDVPCSGDLEKDQKLLGETVQTCLKKGICPIILGGGHETAYGHLSGYKGGDEICVLNIDAHTDVRPLAEGHLAHSGSPFRQAIEDPEILINEYRVWGAQPTAVSAAHDEYVKQHGTIQYSNNCTNGHWNEWLEQLRGKRVVLTIDLDVFDQSVAPGVSAPCTNGLSIEHALHIVKTLYESCDVSSADIVELNPRYDLDNQTAGLAARLVWEQLMAIATSS